MRRFRTYVAAALDEIARRKLRRQRRARLNERLERTERLATEAELQRMAKITKEIRPGVYVLRDDDEEGDQ